jgi:hypothetical protein
MVKSQNHLQRTFSLSEPGPRQGAQCIAPGKHLTPEILAVQNRPLLAAIHLVWPCSAEIGERRRTAQQRRRSATASAWKQGRKAGLSEAAKGPEGGRSRALAAARVCVRRDLRIACSTSLGPHASRGCSSSRRSNNHNSRSRILDLFPVIYFLESSFALPVIAPS